jgi:TDG/mug DNA glycosylase family protein
VNDPSLEVYEARALEWEERRARHTTDEAVQFGADVRAQQPAATIADLGCGPGWYAEDLGPGPVVALDATRAMLDLVPRHAPSARRVLADLRALPFRRGSLDAAWASKSYVHLPRTLVPLALADLHRSLRVDALVELIVFGGDVEHDELPGDRFPGRRFSLWPAELLRAVVEGSGFDLLQLTEVAGKRIGETTLRVRMRRRRTLPDYVAGEMRLLLVGLNPSLYAADRGVGFARPGNRFWPAALAAGIVTRDRDPIHALTQHGIGMTDLAKRATARADELDDAEYRAGFERLARTVAWLRPRAVCVIGLTGWRVVTNRAASAGLQAESIEEVPVYVMPNTSGLNAHASLRDLTDHLVMAYAVAG